MGIELVPLHSDTMRRRREELSKLFKRLYEDNVLGQVTDEQYRMLADRGSPSWDRIFLRGCKIDFSSCV